MPDDDKIVNILVVSRDEAVLADARFGFPTNAEVVTAADAREAQKVLEDYRPSVVIVDLMTGSAGGFALARAMSEMTDFKEIPLLFLLDREQDAWLAGQAGAALYRTKPISAEMLAADALSLAS